jgi:hypothetical protein
MKAKGSPLRFRGVPTRLLATFHAPERLPEGKTGRVVLPDTEPLPLIVHRVPSATALSVLSFRLPTSTRPGSYEGSAELGGRQVPIVVEIEARFRLRFIPAKLSLAGTPGARIPAEVVVVNQGNVNASIKREYTFCIFADRGVDQAFYEALVVNRARGKRRIDCLMDELAEAHGGLVQAVVQKGQGNLAPGESRELLLQFQLSRRMHPGQTYRGTWLISEAGLEVEIQASQPDREDAQ